MRLRLVGRDEPAPGRTTDGERPRPLSAVNARRDVARENHAAAVSSITEQDVRLLFAGEVKQCVEGGRAAILRPERRRALFERADALGLRAFDANLVIAIVQEAARRGEDVTIPERGPRSGRANLQVLAELLPKEPKPSGRDEVIRFALIAVGLAVCILAGLIGAMGR